MAKITTGDIIGAIGITLLVASMRGSTGRLMVIGAAIGLALGLLQWGW